MKIIRLARGAKCGKWIELLEFVIPCARAAASPFKAAMANKPNPHETVFSASRREISFGSIAANSI
jgi:hypothetical protein